MTSETAAAEIVEIALPYQATYRLPRKRNLDTGWFRATIPVAVDSVSDAEAPVVCRVRSSARIREKEDQFDYSVRHHGGGFWRPSHGWHEGEIALDRLRTLAAAAPGTEGWGGNPFAAIVAPRSEQSYNPDWINGLPAIESVGAKEIDRSGRDEAETLLRRGIADFRLIGDVLYERCAEPRIVVSRLDYRVQFEVSTSAKYDDAAILAVFRADRIKEARAFCLALAREVRPRWGDRHFGLGTVPRIETPGARFLRRDDLMEAVALQSPGILKKAREFAAWLPRPEMAHFLDMRDAQARVAGPDGTRADAISFCEAYARLVAWSKTLDETVVVRTRDLPYAAQSFGSDHGRLLAFWRTYEGGSAAQVALDEADGEALAELGAGPAGR